MKLHQIHTVQRLPISLGDAWDFFSSPLNLATITPPWLDFRVQTAVPPRMHPGMIIAYTIRPVLRVPVQWVTEITHVDEPYFFVDEQRFGPYRFWHHQHLFREVEGGVECEDLVHYALPAGPLGGVAHALYVRRQLEAIFAYRRRVLEERFGRLPAGAGSPAGAGAGAGVARASAGGSNRR